MAEQRATVEQEPRVRAGCRWRTAGVWMIERHCGHCGEYFVCGARYVERETDEGRFRTREWACGDCVRAGLVDVLWRPTFR